MKRLFLSAALIVLAAGCTQNKPADTQTTAATQASAKPINTHCPVDRDDEIDPKVTYLYNGQVIGFCCEKCIPEFKKDPEKYMKDLK
ncbi:MAG TPA: YHS domain-containing protein [Tepidisphaeraceae bacterium]|nr:YHS domain-containing protein [Tepidisphaeraceae bacterium]